ncbi:MAG: response regulator [Treponema sp.]|nr:response regulator [Treponema sp.]
MNIMNSELQNAQTTIPRAEVSSGCWTGKRVLIVDDMDFNRVMLALCLGKTGLIVEEARNGFEAVKLYTEDPDLYSMILMDIEMPVMNGLDATRAIRSSGKSTAQDIPIIAISSRTLVEDLEACQNAGMNAHVPKPVDLKKLIRLMSYWFGEI